MNKSPRLDFPSCGALTLPTRRHLVLILIGPPLLLLNSSGSLLVFPLKFSLLASSCASHPCRCHLQAIGMASLLQPWLFRPRVFPLALSVQLGLFLRPSQLIGIGSTCQPDRHRCGWHLQKFGLRQSWILNSTLELFIISG